MAIGRISGQMLKSNLSRSGTDLTFETNLLALDVSNSRVGVGTASPAVKLHVSSTDAIRVPSGTTAQRPGSPANGDIRYNSTTSQIEGYSNGEFRSMVGSGLASIEEDTSPQLGGNLDVKGFDIVSARSNENINITPNGTGSVVTPKLQATTSLIAANLTYPTADGTNGQYLQTNGSGTLSFSTVPISGTTFTLGSWTISVVSNELVFSYNGTGVAKIGTNGQITSADDVTAYGTV